MTIRVGIIGLGYGRQVLIPAFRADDRVHIRAVAARRIGKAAECAAAEGIDLWFDDWRRMLAEAGLDAVAVACPPSAQPEMVCAALGHGLAVFCEKPVATDPADASRMATAAEKAGRPNMVDFLFPELETWRRAKAMVDAAEFGRPLHAHLSWHFLSYAVAHGLDSWKRVGIEGGGVVAPVLSHSFHALEWLFGPISGISARLAPDDRRETSAILALAFDSGMTASVGASIDSAPLREHRLDVTFAHGCLRLENSSGDHASGFRLLAGSHGDGSMALIAEETATGGDGRIVPASRLARRFCDWIADGTPGGPTLADGLRVQRLIAATGRAHRDRVWIPVDGDAGILGL
ncbi:Gfo/Idh/MocA family protein [Magnetospirillum sp. SS-4]|uniref:Gfo/Idh/MocA family protein n=1 Tax=Magnetospirillum sp. SS-4 TaxID=2681465 RepID=UPI001380A604|nr:Gfo/Idh/MocA family oxidoreductase [Magnetospirillum sp. SS-4]CAA7625986.1 putative Oxidoreductase [Magnetospirillum sp. SS-4]